MLIYYTYSSIRNKNTYQHSLFFLYRYLIEPWHSAQNYGKMRNLHATKAKFNFFGEKNITLRGCKKISKNGEFYPFRQATYCTFFTALFATNLLHFSVKSFSRNFSREIDFTEN